MEKCACMTTAMHILLSVSIKPTAVVEGPFTSPVKLTFTSPVKLTFDCLSFVTQQLQQRQERLVVSKHPVFGLVLLLSFVSQRST
jgi:hypothetical protein